MCVCVCERAKELYIYIYMPIDENLRMCVIVCLRVLMCVGVGGWVVCGCERHACR